MLLDTNFGYKAEAAYWKEEALRLQVKCDELDAQKDLLVDTLEHFASDKWNNQHWVRRVAADALSAVQEKP